MAFDGVVLVEVFDTSCIHHLPGVRSADDDDEGSRGLVLVEAVSQQWGYYPTADGKAVWALLGQPQEQPVALPSRTAYQRREAHASGCRRARSNPRIHAVAA